MGITGLLPFIKNSCRPVNIRDFRGVTVAIDAYSWLHKGAFSCAEKLVKGEKTDGYVHYCMKLLNMLLDAGVKPVMVFDGCNLESKAVTEKKRRENRERTRQKGKEFLCQGKLKEAKECFQRCIDVTPEMAFEVILACRAKNIDYIVAPYEADAQLAYLNISNMCQIVITEDSDLVLFGCEKILFKMDSCGGGIMYEKEYLSKSFGMQAEKMSFEKFRYMCILSGCDYLPSLPGIGLVKACKFFSLTNNPDLNSVLPKLPSYLKMPKLYVTPEYIENFLKANNTFLYQLVYCPKRKALVPLHPYPEGMSSSDMEYAGKYFPDDLAVQIATGDVNVKTLRKFNGLTPKKKTDLSHSVSKGGSSLLPRENELTSQEPNSLSFKFKRHSEEPTSSAKKRAFHETNIEREDLKKQNDLLFSAYFTDKSKKLKKEAEIEDEENADDSGFSSEDITFSLTPKRAESSRKDRNENVDSEISPLRKSFASNVIFNSSKANTASMPLQKVVKSRFFVNSIPKKNSDASTVTCDNSEEKKSSVKPKISSGLMDSIDDEYGQSVRDSSQINSSYSSDTISDSTESIITNTSNYNTTESEIEPSPAIRDNKENFKRFSLLSFKFSEPRSKLLLGSQGSSFNESQESLECDGDVTPMKRNIHSMLPFKNVRSNSPGSPRKPLSSLECSDDVLYFDIADSPVKDSEEVPTRVPFLIKEKLVPFETGAKKVSKSLFSEDKKPVGGKATGCRSIGLSKNRTKSAKQMNIQDTLLRFKFTRVPKSMPTAS